MEFKSNKPDYLQKYKNISRGFFVTSAILAVVAILNPILLIAAVIFLILGILRYREARSDFNTFLDKGIEFYESKNFVQAEIELIKALELDKKKTKAIILLALVKYELKEYKDAIEFFESLPQEKINQELDLNIKLVEAYLNEKEFIKAEKLLRKLQKIQPKSEYIANGLKKCEAKE